MGADPSGAISISEASDLSRAEISDRSLYASSLVRAGGGGEECLNMILALVKATQIGAKLIALLLFQRR